MKNTIKIIKNLLDDIEDTQDYENLEKVINFFQEICPCQCENGVSCGCVDRNNIFQEDLETGREI